MPNTFFSSDHHFDHGAIIKYCNRPFSSVEEMNETMIEKHNKIVKPGDHFWIVGDFVFSRKKERVHELMDALNGYKYVVLGNHDTDHLFPVKGSKFWRMIELSGGIWHPYNPTVSHFPMESWEKSFHGSFNLHGHTHNTLPFDPTKRRMDVGVDANNFAPVAWEDIVKKLSAIPTRKEQSTK